MCDAFDATLQSTILRLYFRFSFQFRWLAARDTLIILNTETTREIEFVRIGFQNSFGQLDLS